MMVCYPRLSRSLALVEAARIKDAMRLGGVSSVSSRARVHHERQQPVSTGRIATPGEIGEARSRVSDAVSSWLAAGRITDKAAFDRELGAALHDCLGIVPADAAHEETWNFLSTVVFPDVLVVRFPQMSDDRVIGGHRNVLRKAWIRHEILGDELLTLDLKEDELVGLFERTALVRNRRLAHLTAHTVSEHRGPKRDEWARKFYKLLTFQTGVRLLDSLGDEALEKVVQDCADGADSLSLLASELGVPDD